MDEKLKGTPDGAQTEELMRLVVDVDTTRLHLLHLLDNMKELPVEDLAEMVGVSVSTVQQHLAKLKAHGLVAARRDAQTVHYRLTDHPFNKKLPER